MPILGDARKELRLALEFAFQDYDDLNRLSREGLNFSLNTKTHREAGLDKAIDVLITAMDERGRIPQLIAVARQERPDNGVLHRAEEKLGLIFDPFGDVQPSNTILPKLREIGPEAILVASAGMPSAEDVIARLGLAESQVCAIDYGLPGAKKVCGSGFLVADDLVMTNWHVIKAAAQPFTLSGSQIELRFDFRNRHSKTSSHSLVDSNWLEVYDPEQREDKTAGLDYAILRLKTKAGAELLGQTSGAQKRDYLRAVAYTPTVDEPLLVLQHPFNAIEGVSNPMRLTIGFVQEVSESEIKHSANTMKGSSGAPVFNSKCELIGLHYWGDHAFNAAKRFGEIKKDLRSKGSEHLLT